jgi:hypothetical protein
MLSSNTGKPLTEDQVISIIRENVENQFPKICSACSRQFISLKEYLQNTTHLGEPRSYDAEDQDWEPYKPLGTFSFSKCNHCENTLSLGSSSMKISTMWQLLRWARKEKKQKGIPIREILNNLRTKIDNQVLTEESSL